MSALASTIPRLAVGLAAGGMWADGDPGAAIATAVELDRAGIDTVVVVDHVVMGTRTDRYEWGQFPFPSGSPWNEPLTMLAAIAACTHTIRLATGILIAGLRPAPVLAKSIATLDRISNGRVELGVGVGWQREEFDACGLDFASRGRLLTDTIAACRSLWSANPCGFTSETVAFEGIYCDPKPAVERLPVLFSGVLNKRNVDRIVRLGDGWIPIMGASGDDVIAGIVELKQRFVEVGRSPSELRVRMPLPLVRYGRSGGTSGAGGLSGPAVAAPGPGSDVDWAKTLDGATRLAEAGVTEFGLQLRTLVSHPDDVPQWAAELMDRWNRFWA